MRTLMIVLLLTTGLLVTSCGTSTSRTGPRAAPALDVTSATTPPAAADAASTTAAATTTVPATAPAPAPANTPAVPLVVPVEGTALSVAVDADGAVWAVTTTETPDQWWPPQRAAASTWTLVRLVDGQLEDVARHDGPETPAILRDRPPVLLGVAPDGSLWLHETWTDIEGPRSLWQVAADAWIDQTGAAELSTNPSFLTGNEVAMGPDGTVWTHGVSAVTGAHQIARSSGGTWVTIPVPERTSAPGELDLLAFLAGGPAGSALLVHNVLEYTSGRQLSPSLVRFDGEKWTEEALVPPLAPAQRVDRLAAGTDGAIWALVTGDGAATWRRFDGTAWQRIGLDLSAPIDPACSGVFDLATPAERAGALSQAMGQVTVAGDGTLYAPVLCAGVQHVDPMAGTSALLTDGLPSRLVYGLAVGPDGAVWVAGVGGLTRMA